MIDISRSEAGRILMLLACNQKINRNSQKGKEEREKEKKKGIGLDFVFLLHFTLNFFLWSSYSQSCTGGASWVHPIVSHNYKRQHVRIPLFLACICPFLAPRYCTCWEGVIRLRILGVSRRLSDAGHRKSQTSQ